MEYQLGPDFGSYSRRGNRHLVDYVTVDATQKTDEKITKMVFHLNSVPVFSPVGSDQSPGQTSEVFIMDPLSLFPHCARPSGSLRGH